jgi:hypothetical protein
LFVVDWPAQPLECANSTNAGWNLVANVFVRPVVFLERLRCFSSLDLNRFAFELQCATQAQVHEHPTYPAPRDGAHKHAPRPADGAPVTLLLGDRRAPRARAGRGVDDPRPRSTRGAVTFACIYY